MSNELYPLSLIARQRVTPFNQVVRDDFESGDTATRRLWTTKHQKRQFAIDHAPLTVQEYKTLRQFSEQRDLTYDSFWYRDNVMRGGNAKVRFAAPVQANMERRIIGVSVAFEEVAPIRVLPDYDEVAEAAGATPIAWYSPNRQIYYEHLGTAYYEQNASAQQLIHDCSLSEAHPLVMQAGTHPLSNKFSQYQYWRAGGTEWAKTSANVSSSLITGTQPALTWFIIHRQKTASSAYCICSVGAASSGGAFGVGIDASNRFGVWSGAAVVNGASTNSPNETWRSIALATPAATNTAQLYSNGVFAENISVTRTHAAGPVSFFAAASGGNIFNSEADSVADVAQAILFNDFLSSTEIEALHNLFAYQMGMAEA